MKLVITGGGTGGHIYPALVVGQFAMSQGAEILYFGSRRGQESKACADRSIPFTPFDSYPLYSLRTLRGIKALIKLQQARILARQALKAASPDVVFSTGGYSAGPVVAAARDVGIPYTIHTSDSIPARSSRMFAKGARAFTSTFRSTASLMTERDVIRTGQPIRPELRAAAAGRIEQKDSVFVIGGSQGSAFLNSTVPKAALNVSTGVRFLHACGPDHLAATTDEIQRLNLADRYQVVPYLKTEEMVEAYRNATVVVARSGGTVAELALFGLPSVLVPLPDSANGHQAHNAQEFAEMNAATVLKQSESSPERMASALTAWLSDEGKRLQARETLSEWDMPDATDRIVKLIQEAAG